MYDNPIISNINPGIRIINKIKRTKEESIILSYFLTY